MFKRKYIKLPVKSVDSDLFSSLARLSFLSGLSVPDLILLILRHVDHHNLVDAIHRHVCGFEGCDC